MFPISRPPTHTFLLKSCAGPPRLDILRPVDVSYFTSTPIERAEPATMFIAASKSLALRSRIFFSAISFTCAFVSEPIFSVFGRPEPFSLPNRSEEHTSELQSQFHLLF